MPAQDDVIAAIDKLQRLVRRPPPDTAVAVAHIPAGDPTPSGTPALGLLDDEVTAAREAQALIEADLRYEHVPDPKAEIERFIVRCFQDRDIDQVQVFVDEHAKQPETQTCFIHGLER